MKKALAVLLLVLGSFLEVYYYYFRFTQDGTPWQIAVIIGVALNFLLIGVTVNRWWILFIPLLLFSVLSTSSGQTFALIQKQVDQTKGIYAPEIEALRKDSQRAGEELEEINKQILGTVSTLEDRYEWKNTLAAAEQRKRDLETRLIENRRREAEIGNQVVSGDRETVYTFYARIGNGMERADWLKFLLHTALSVFIALMAPTGLAMTGLREGYTGEEPEAVKMDVDTWVRFMWRGMRKGNKGIPTPEQMREYCYIAGIPFDLAKHEEYSREAIAEGLLAPKEGLKVSQEYAQKKMNKMQKKI